MDSVLEYIKKSQLIAIMRGLPAEKIPQVAEALNKGGVNCIEVTFNQKGDFNDTAKGIKSIIALNIPELCVGAGTVLTVEQVDIAYKAGAKYIISPDTNLDVIKHTKELGLVSIPGSLTPTEITAAYNLGADIVKLFPAGNLGPGYIKAIKAPISHIPLAAVGGIKLENIREFKDAGINCFGIAKYIIDEDAVANDDYDAIAKKAKAFMDKLK